ncbi:hypothetical protein [Vibrio mangrovi]|uniref:Uncharacterized protein n=1 Tax=Vibrio mangrovi TaxID=474394 RepID=A0A1Y6J0S9_9VIBR|nr:hypothetical protein [Vibrio mangrovi]MDW6002843.1 hypothetical protein [Vibrio mangrovi]SMS02332.1 hypothetical protein VIM7927_03652 [Vibrio mangrovi]
MISILSIFALLVLGIVLGAGSSYVPLETLESTIFPYASISILVAIIIALSIYKGTKEKPAGFKYLVLHYKEGRYKEFFFVLMALPFFSFIMGYFVYMVFATLPAYPTKLLSENVYVKPSICIKTGRGKIRGSWSLFRLENGEEWKVSGFGQVCPNHRRSCNVTYKQGIMGYYVLHLECS